MGRKFRPAPFPAYQGGKLEGGLFHTRKDEGSENMLAELPFGFAQGRQHRPIPPSTFDSTQGPGGTSPTRRPIIRTLLHTKRAAL